MDKELLALKRETGKSDYNSGTFTQIRPKFGYVVP